MAATTQVSPQRARENAAAIRSFWQRGRDGNREVEKLRDKEPDALSYGNREATYRRLAVGLGANVDTAAKMRRAAEEYSEKQINDLCGSVRRCRSRFSATHLLALLRVEDRGRRNDLARRPVREGWSCARLRRAVQAARGGRRPHVGRRQDVPADPTELLLALDALADKWVRWCDRAKPRLRGKLRARIDRATKAVNLVREAVAERLTRRSARGMGGET